MLDEIPLRSWCLRAQFPLMSKSRKISRMLAEQDEQRPAGQRQRGRGSSEGNVEEHAAAEIEIEDAEEEDGDEEQQHVRMHDGKSYRITFPDFPGGPGTFEAAPSSATASASSSRPGTSPRCGARPSTWR